MIEAPRLWALLYAQVHEADDADMRNLLLSRRQAPTEAQGWNDRRAAPRADSGTTTWSEREVVTLLAMLGMGPDAPLSCLVVETLPGAKPVNDPLGAGLGYERFLRASPLTAVPPQC